MKKTRQQLREKYSDEMCREVRFQLVRGIDQQRLFSILIKMDACIQEKQVRASKIKSFKNKIGT